MAQGLSANLLFVVLTGFLPPLLWLWFWLKEDPHPEPRKTLILSFVLGMAVVPVVLFLEYLFYRLALKSGLARPWRGELTSLVLLFGWAFLEEGAKFLTAWWADLKRSVYDEPVDALIYLITVALGFSALENVLFLTNLLGEGVAEGVITANLRFFGATLLHTVTAGVMGVSVALAFFHPEKTHRNIVGGLILATLLHGFFNAFIIKTASSAGLFQIFSVVWTLIIILIFFFEKIKKLHA